MTLTSIYFFAFVLGSLILYYVIPKRFRWVVLLVASVAFYCICCAKYFPFIVFTALSTWAGALWISAVNNKRKDILKVHKAEWDSVYKKKFKAGTVTRKRLILCLILVLNFGILATLKYYNFLADWFGGLIGVEFPSIGILLPLGISFYTFQSMGYIIDIYWEKAEPMKNPAKFGLFVSFFPQIVQGPIAVYDELAYQLFEGHDIEYGNIKSGFQLFLWGLFKKMVIADRMVIILDAILPEKNNLPNFYSFLAIIVYSFQLYMDFSGGIDIVAGVAKMFGINLAENFRRPFFSRSLSEFWRRWHISLGHWLKNYLFYPIALSKAFLKFGKCLSGNPSDKDIPDNSLWGGFTFRQHFGRVFPGCIATLITFFVIGMWHGANWKYAGFGIYNGLVILFAMLLEPVFRWILRKLHINSGKLPWIIWQIIRTYIIAMAGFIFDLGDGLLDSINMLVKAFTPSGAGSIAQTFNDIGITLEPKDYIIILIGLAIVLCVSLYQEISKKTLRGLIDRWPSWIQWLILLAAVIIIFLWGVYGPFASSSGFVYMQF